MPGLIRPIAVALLLAAHLPAQAQPLPAAHTPAQLAYIKSETRKANDHFVKQVAKITGATEPAVRRALPDEKRITDRVTRLVSALEKDLQKPLDEGQKAAIVAAEDERRVAVTAAQKNARTK